MTKILTTDSFESEVLKSDKPVLVDFWATWCGPCQNLMPTIDELALELEGKAVVAKLDIDDHAETAAAYGVMSVPTVIIFKDGEEVERLVGGRPKEDYLDLLI